MVGCETTVLRSLIDIRWSMRPRMSGLSESRDKHMIAESLSASGLSGNATSLPPDEKPPTLFSYQTFMFLNTGVPCREFLGFLNFCACWARRVAGPAVGQSDQPCCVLRDAVGKAQRHVRDRIPRPTKAHL
jgi:hypothetical protein